MFSKKINPEKVKKKNTKLLKKLGIDVIDHLPWIEVGEQRSSQEIAKRCVTLAALLQLHFGAPRDFIENYLKENKLFNEITKEEHKLLEVDYDDLDKQEQIDLYWTMEAIWTLSWVGNLHNSLSFNTEVEDTLAQMLPSFEKEETAKDFITSFKARNHAEVFTELDKFYRAHWFAKNNNLSGKKSSLVDLDIVMERRKALEWVSDITEDWDEISLDT